MTKRLTELGGTDFGNESPTKEDVNDTNRGILHAGTPAVAQCAYQILQANDVFENKDLLATDEFIDANGTNNTVNTSATDAEYNLGTDTYSRAVSGGDGNDDTNTYGFTNDSTNSNDDFRGILVQMKGDHVIVSATKHSSCTATTLQLVRHSDSTSLGSATFVGDVATFASPVQVSDGVEYRIVCRIAFTVNYTQIIDSGITFPVTSTAFDVTAGIINTSSEDSSNMYNIESVVTQDVAYSDSSIVTGTILTPAVAPSGAAVYLDGTFPSGSQIEYLLSDDGGVTFGATSGTVSTNTAFIPSTTLTGTAVALKVIMSGTTSTVTPRVKGYGLCLNTPTN